MTIEDRKVEKPARERSIGSEEGATGGVAGRAASISSEAGKDYAASPGAEADKQDAEDR